MITISYHLEKLLKKEIIGNLGHYCELGDGKFSMTAGWHSIQAVYGSDDWLGYKSDNQKYNYESNGFLSSP